jgi:predicted kinase
MLPFICAFGIPGAGKTAASVKLQDILGYKSHGSLEERRTLGKATHDTADDALVADLLYSHVSADLQKGNGVIIDTPGNSAQVRARVYAWAEGYGASLLVIELVCPLAVAQERVRSRSLSPDGIIVATTDPSVCGKYYGAWEPITLLEADRHNASYIVYDSHRNGIDLLHIHPETAALTHKIADILLR